MDTEVTESTESVESAAPEGMDIEAAADSIGDDLFGSQRAESEEQPAEETATTEEAAPVEEAAPARKPPQSWAKDKHEIWAKLPADAQEYYELREQQMLQGLESYKTDAQFARQMKEVFNPHQEFLRQQGFDEVKATSYLLNAHIKLSTANEAERNDYFRKLAGAYGVNLGGLGTDAPQVDPAVEAMQREIASVKNALSSREKQEYEAKRAEIAKTVDAFASDPAHAYFDEVAGEIMAHLQAGDDLQSAYEKAVWANPVTRQKELARVQKESADKLKEKARLDALVAKKAAGPNVRSRDTRKAPTESMGSMEDTMKETLSNIRQRTH